eukprot:1190037-Prorocentrum_minimum.AAC.3
MKTIHHSVTYANENHARLNQCPYLHQGATSLYRPRSLDTLFHNFRSTLVCLSGPYKYIVPEASNLDVHARSSTSDPTSVYGMPEHLANLSFWWYAVTDLVLVMSVNPGFGGQSFIESQVEKIKDIRRRCDAKGVNPWIEVDGGVGPANAYKVIEAGANAIVAGSAVFNSSDYAAAIQGIKNSKAPVKA